MKEKIKQFLKLNSVKALLFIVIGFIAVFLGSNFLKYLDYLSWEAKPITFYTHLNSFFWFPLKLLHEDPSMILYSGIEKLVLPLLITIIYWYLLSCLIVFIYNKFKGRKQRRISEKKGGTI